MGHASRNIENSGSEEDLNCGGLAQEVSVEQNVSVWPRDCSCDILAKNVATFLPLSKKFA